MYKLVIFDLDGTLLDTSRTICSVLNESLKKFSLPAVSVEKTIEYVGNGAKKLVERAVGEERKDLVEPVYKDYSINFSDCKDEFTVPYDGARDTLIKLGKVGVTLAIITNKPKQATVRAYNKFLSDCYFSEVIGQSSGSPLKPNPQSTLELIRKFGVKSEECLFVGDGETDVQTALNAGIDCVSVLWGFRTKEQLEVAGAVNFVTDFKELERIVLNK